jgi:hypothetical protein
VPNDRYRHQEDPDISNQIRYVGEVCERDEFKAFALHVRVPKCCYRSAYEGQCDCYSNSPCNDECSGREHELAEERDDEDAVIEGEDSKLDGNEGDIVEVAEDVVTLQL